MVAPAIIIASAMSAPIPAIVPAIPVTVVAKPEIHADGGTGIRWIAPVAIVWIIGAVGRPINTSA